MGHGAVGGHLADHTVRIYGSTGEVKQTLL